MHFRGERKKSPEILTDEKTYSFFGKSHEKVSLANFFLTV